MGSGINGTVDGCLTINEAWEWDGTAQGLIDNAEAGDTVVLPCGDYDERLSITQDINLVGGECEDRAQNGPRSRKGMGMNFSERQNITFSASNINFGADDYAEQLPVVSVDAGVSGSLSLSSVTIDAGGSGQAAINTGDADLSLSDSEVLNSSGIVLGTDVCGSYDISGNTFDSNSNNLAAGSCEVSGSGNFFGCSEGLECGIEGDNVDFTDSSCDADGNVLDECGECGGDGTSCFNETASVTYNTQTAVYGFQFAVTGAELAGVSGGAAEANGFTVSYSCTTGYTRKLCACNRKLKTIHSSLSIIGNTCSFIKARSSITTTLTTLIKNVAIGIT
jgi:hypothetical protein